MISVNLCEFFAATARAYAEAERSGKDEIVLFSPACASFDQYSDFEARGDAFKEAVNDVARSAAVAGVSGARFSVEGFGRASVKIAVEQRYQQ